MDSASLKPEQVDKLVAQVGRQLAYLNKLCGRMQRMNWPLDDPVCAKALVAQRAIQDLYRAAREAGTRG